MWVRTSRGYDMGGKIRLGHTRNKEQEYDGVVLSWHGLARVNMTDGLARFIMCDESVVVILPLSDVR